jgi:EAL domain-containing protein (putative c-di-GMP-specific phosphodiesterase class I)
MTPRSIFANLVRGDDGSISTAYGPFVLRSALQPIFRMISEFRLQIEAFEGLVRVFRDGEPIAPGEFFNLVEPSDLPAIDSILRTIHILNTGRLSRARARIFVKFQPGIIRTPHEMRQEVERIKLAGHEAGMSPERIVCEISETAEVDEELIVAFSGHMRAIGFGVAIDDYGTGASSLERLKRIRPDYVKFDPSWVRDFFDNPAGTALLRVIVQQMFDDGIEPIIEGLEEMWQVELCEQLGVRLVQGYALARPELAPTTFNESFPEYPTDLPTGSDRTGENIGLASHASGLRSSPNTKPHGRQIRAFGKRRWTD